MRKILIIVQRSNGDVLLSSPVINALHAFYPNVSIDLLVNDDTLGIAKTLNGIRHIHLFSYLNKKENRWRQERDIIAAIYKKYDLSISLTASDRSILYAVLASNYAIGAREAKGVKSWWKKIFLKKSYVFDTRVSIVENNMKSISSLNIPQQKIEVVSASKENDCIKVSLLLKQHKIEKFVIFHPSAQYAYKIYPKYLRDKLLGMLNTLQIPIVVTGSKSPIDVQIKDELPSLENVYDFMGETSLSEYIALSSMAEAYIGMDTLNMHIAAAQNKRIFAIFGPTILSTWSPWSNRLQRNTKEDMPLQTYGEITIFQADMVCVACGLAGCDDRHGISECLGNINPEVVFNEVKRWLIK